jgi:hypothetical protein
VLENKMRFVEAFKSLGYDLSSPRQDWSAEKVDGVCITLWKEEVDRKPPPPRFDLCNHWDPAANDWQHLQGHSKRLRHLNRAVSELDGWADMIIVGGKPGEGYETADPWLPNQRLNHGWRITKFDNETGFFAASAEKLE